jgi:hypothetical protein
MPCSTAASSAPATAGTAGKGLAGLCLGATRPSRSSPFRVRRNERSEQRPCAPLPYGPFSANKEPPRFSIMRWLKRRRDEGGETRTRNQRLKRPLLCHPSRVSSPSSPTYEHDWRFSLFYHRGKGQASLKGPCSKRPVACRKITRPRASMRTDPTGRRMASVARMRDARRAQRLPVAGRLRSVQRPRPT